MLLVPTSPAGRASPAGIRLRAYLADPRVRRRIVEFLGGPSLAEATCHFLSSPSPSCAAAFAPRPVGDLWRLLVERGEVARSLWDRRALVADLDVEHVHYDRSAEPLRHPRRSRRLQAPVVAAIEGLFAEHGIAALHYLTGRGHHWTWSIPWTSACALDLARLGTLDVALQERYLRPVAPSGEAVGLAAGAAFAGLGKVLEYLGHRILAATAASSEDEVPVELTAAAVAPGSHGREAISIDLSLFGDPLDRRGIRVPFTPYRKYRTHEASLFIAVPVPPGREEEAAAATTDPAAAARLAETTSIAIPDGADGTHELLRRYRHSDLASLHREFYTVEIDPAERWPETYDRLELASLPPCAARVLEHPNDLLLQPAALQLLVRVLLAQGWHPRHVAGLVRSKLERDHGWIPEVHFHEPGCRADFYVRLFTGLALLRPNDLRDFDCAATAGRSLCPGPRCAWRLGDLRAKLHAH